MEQRITERIASTASARGLSADRFVRTHAVSVATLAVATIACIAIAQVQSRSDVSLALSYAIPLWLLAYAAGPVLGGAAAIAVAALWLFDAASLGLSTRDLAYVFTARLLANIGLVVMAVFSARAAEARDGHLAAQADLFRLRRDVAAAFSHDLRTPLSAIACSLQVLREQYAEWRSAAAIDAIDRAVANVHRLDQLIRDMMGVEQSSSPFALHVSTIQPFQLINDLQTEFATLRLNPDKVLLTWEVEPSTPALRTDRDKLTSIVRNLVSNALKFTYVGTVKVRIGYEHESGMHRITVTDTGRGIGPETLPHIFTRFYRGDETRGTGGFGFGLFVVKTFVDILDGTIGVTSRLDEGSAFVVHLPRLVAEREPNLLLVHGSGLQRA